MQTVIGNGGGVRLWLLDLIFPNHCPFCEEVISYDLLCCEKCFNEILWADEHICLKCGKPKPEGCICSHGTAYDMCVPAAYYRDNVTEAICGMKFLSRTNAAVIFGRVIGDRLKELSAADKIDLAVPVPMLPRQERIRGYNQAELIAEEIAERIDVPVRTDLLIRKNVRKAQHHLTAEERASSAEKQYFAAGEPDLYGKTVLLTDDVLTTGSTLNRCARLLKEYHGAQRVICAVAATV